MTLDNFEEGEQQSKWTPETSLIFSDRKEENDMAALTESESVLDHMFDSDYRYETQSK